MTWHADAALLRSYSSDAVDATTAASLEAHLVSCAECRTTLAAATTPATDARLDAAWAEIVDVVDRPRVHPLERVLARVGVSEADARIVVTTPGLRAAWTLAIALAVAFAVFASGGDAEDPLLLLWLAPVVPLVGVALAFGPVLDPMYEVSLATPTSALRFLALRTLAVAGAAALVLVPASLLVPGVPGHAAAWIAPAVAMCAVALALGTVIDPRAAVVATAAAWLLLVPVVMVVTAPPPQSVTTHLALFRAPGQIAAVVVACVAIAVLVRRRDRISLPTIAPGGHR